MILTESGTLYAFGYAGHGQLGLGTVKNQSEPCPIKSFVGSSVPGFEEFEERIIQLSLGQNHSLALSNAGFVYSCGSSKVGQLGHADFEMATTFTQVMLQQEVHRDSHGPGGGLLYINEDKIPLRHVIEISAGGNHSWAIQDSAAYLERMRRLLQEKHQEEEEKVSD